MYLNDMVCFRRKDTVLLLCSFTRITKLASGGTRVLLVPRNWKHQLGFILAATLPPSGYEDLLPFHHLVVLIHTARLR